MAKWTARQRVILRALRDAADLALVLGDSPHIYDHIRRQEDYVAWLFDADNGAAARDDQSRGEAPTGPISPTK